MAQKVSGTSVPPPLRVSSEECNVRVAQVWRAKGVSGTGLESIMGEWHKSGEDNGRMAQV